MVRLRATSVKHGAFERRWCMVRLRATWVKHGAFARRWCMVRLRTTSVKHGAFVRRWCMVRLRATSVKVHLDSPERWRLALLLDLVARPCCLILSLDPAA